MRLDRIICTLDRRQLRRVLSATVAHLESGLSAEQADEFCTDLEALAPDEDVMIEATVRYKGHDLPFVVDAFKQDGLDCEAVFIVPRVLGELVQEQLRRECGSAQIQVLSGGSEEVSE